MVNFGLSKRQVGERPSLFQTTGWFPVVLRIISKLPELLSKAFCFWSFISHSLASRRSSSNCLTFPLNPRRTCLLFVLSERFPPHTWFAPYQESRPVSGSASYPSVLVGWRALLLLHLLWGIKMMFLSTISY